MTTCKSGRHDWLDEASAERCCNGWHRELRLGGARPGDDPRGKICVGGLPEAQQAVFVWVKDEEREESLRP
jgi:hypothetical protein